MHRNNAHLGFSVRYRMEVLNADGLLVRRIAAKKNLILDAGLDRIATSHYIAQGFAYAVIGTGTTPTRRDSGAVTVSRSGTTLLASAGFFEAADAGRLFKFDTGEEVRIVTFTDSTHVETLDSGAIAAAEGTVWYVNQTALAAEVKRSATYGVDSGDNGSTFLTDTWTFKRSFIFSAEVGTVTYREVGWSHIPGAGANLFGRDLFAGGGVTLVAGQQLKVIAELSVQLSPAVSTPWTNVITGWSEDGDCGVEHAAIAQVVASGAGTTPNGSTGLEPLVNKVWSLNATTTAIGAMASSMPAVVTPTARVTATGEAYVSGSFSRKFIGKATVLQLNASTHRSILFGEADGAFNALRPCFRVLLDNAEEKLSTHTLELEFTISWGRILTN